MASKRKISDSLRDAIVAKLCEMEIVPNCARDNPIVDYILVLFTSQKTKELLTSELDIIFNNKTENFVDWIIEINSKLEIVTKNKKKKKEKDRDKFTSTATLLNKNMSGSEESFNTTDEHICDDNCSDPEDCERLRRELMFRKTYGEPALKPGDFSNKERLPSNKERLPSSKERISSIVHKVDELMNIEKPSLKGIPSKLVKKAFTDAKRDTSFVKKLPVIAEVFTPNADEQSTKYSFRRPVSTESTGHFRSSSFIERQQYGECSSFSEDIDESKNVSPSDSQKSKHSDISDLSSIHSPSPSSSVSHDLLNQIENFKVVSPPTFLVTMKKGNTKVDEGDVKGNDKDQLNARIEPKLKLNKRLLKRDVNVPVNISKELHKSAKKRLSQQETTAFPEPGCSFIREKRTKLEVEFDPRIPPPLQEPQDQQDSMAVEDVVEEEDVKMEEDEDYTTSVIPIKCRYFPDCTNDNCPYYHPEFCSNFPICRFGETCMFFHPPCKFGSSCFRADCVFDHPPETAVVVSSYEEPKNEICKFFPDCMNGPACPFIHPKLCKFGADCLNTTCPFVHPKTWKTISKNYSSHGVGPSSHSKYHNSTVWH